MDREIAEQIKHRGEASIKELWAILNIEDFQDRCSPEEMEAIKRTIGLAVGIIDTELLSIAYRQFPELDPIK